jgi:hypothetical protein
VEGAPGSGWHELEIAFKVQGELSSEPALAIPFTRNDGVI